nr:MAG TPA: Mediator of RNA polymerase II, Transcription Activation, Helical, ABD [Bacteriophage sp.]
MFDSLIHCITSFIRKYITQKCVNQHKNYFEKC